MSHAKQDAIDFRENELLGVAYEPRLHQWYSVHAVLTDSGWTAERRDMRTPAQEPHDNAIAAGLLDAAGIPRLDTGGRVLLLWERVYQLAERAQPTVEVRA